MFENRTFIRMLKNEAIETDLIQFYLDSNSCLGMFHNGKDVGTIISWVVKEAISFTLGDKYVVVGITKDNIDSNLNIFKNVYIWICDKDGTPNNLITTNTEDYLLYMMLAGMLTGNVKSVEEINILKLFKPLPYSFKSPDTSNINLTQE